MNPSNNRFSEVPPQVQGLAPGAQFQIRWIGPPVEERLVINGPEVLARIWSKFIATSPAFDPAKEHIVVVVADVRLHFMGWHLVAVGGAGEVGFHLRDVFRAALALDGAALAVIHNHPSGSVEHSAKDVRVTADLRTWCSALGLRFLDHVVVDSEGRSFRSAALPDRARRDSNPPPLLALVGASTEEAVDAEDEGRKVEVSLPVGWVRDAGGNDELRAGMAKWFTGRSSRELAAMWDRTGRLKYLAKYARARKRQVPCILVIPGPAVDALSEAAGLLNIDSAEFMVAAAGAVAEDEYVKRSLLFSGASNIVNIQ